jgi:hypothetical protein
MIAQLVSPPSPVLVVAIGHRATATATGANGPPSGVSQITKQRPSGEGHPQIRERDQTSSSNSSSKI